MSQIKSMAERLAEAQCRIAEIDGDALAARIAAGGCLHIDVREPDEWATARIPGSVLVPLGVVERDVAAKVFHGTIAPPDLERSIVVSCAHGRRSLVGADILKGMGFRDVVSLRGGIDAWARAGRPIES